MNHGGDVAEQMVRMSLEGIEVAAKITGAGAKNLAIILAAVLKEEEKTKGKARLTNMIKSGKELTVFSLPQSDLKKFAQEAKKYGVLYCVVKSTYQKEGKAVIDIITRSEDAPKINRIVERFRLASVDKNKIVSEVEKDVATNKGGETIKNDEAAVNDLLDEVLLQDPGRARTERSPLSEPDSKGMECSPEASKHQQKRSVRSKLDAYKQQNKDKSESGLEKAAAVLERKEQR